MLGLGNGDVRGKEKSLHVQVISQARGRGRSGLVKGRACRESSSRDVAASRVDTHVNLAGDCEVNSSRLRRIQRMQRKGRAVKEKSSKSRSQSLSY